MPRRARGPPLDDAYTSGVISQPASVPPATSEPRTEIRDFVRRAFKGHDLDDADDIFASGVVNSMFAMELVTFVEKSYDIVIESEDLDLENFRTVTRIAELVERKRSG